MQSASFRSTLRLFVKPVEGDSVRQTLLDLVAAHAVPRLSVSGRGTVDGMRLVGIDELQRGPFEVIQLTGHATATELHLTIGALKDGAIVGGTLVDARAVELELDVTLLEEVERPKQRIASAVTPTWAEVAAASVVPDEPDHPDAPTPVVGDRIDHPSFGACVIEKIDEDDEFAMVRNPGKRLLRLSLDALRLELLGEEDGHRHFRARVLKGGRA